MDFLASGESSPFSYQLAASDQDPSGWKAKVEIGSSENSTDLSRVQVGVAHDQMTVSSDGKVYLTGELVNKGNKPAQIRRLAAALFGGPDTVVAADRAIFLRSCWLPPATPTAPTARRSYSSSPGR